MLKQELNKRFSGPYVVVSNSTGLKVEGHEFKENAMRAAQILTQHDKNNGRENSFFVVKFSDWEKL
jgi:hypothetical protein